MLSRKYLLSLLLVFILGAGAFSFYWTDTHSLQGRINWQMIRNSQDPDLTRFQFALKRCLEDEPTLPFDYRSCPDQVATGTYVQPCGTDANAAKKRLVDGLLANASSTFGGPVTWRRLKHLKGVDMTVAYQQQDLSGAGYADYAFFDFGDKTQDYMSQDYSDALQEYLTIAQAPPAAGGTWALPNYAHDLVCELDSGGFKKIQNVVPTPGNSWPAQLLATDYIQTNMSDSPASIGYSFYGTGRLPISYYFVTSDVTLDFTWARNILGRFGQEVREIESLINSQPISIPGGEVRFEYFPAR